MRMKDWFRVLAMFSDREVEERRDEKRERALRVVDLTTSATKPTVICLPSSEQTQRHTHIHLTALSGTTQVSWYQKGKPIWILLKQETVSDSCISWAICKSAPRSRQITTPAPHHSSFLQSSNRVHILHTEDAPSQFKITLAINSHRNLTVNRLLLQAITAALTALKTGLHNSVIHSYFNCNRKPQKT